MRLQLLCFLVCLFVNFATEAETLVDHEEFVGPFASWSDLKRDFHAVGDGKADDTLAIQKALDSLKDNSPMHPAVLFIPAGTYRITAGLTMTSQVNVGVVGADPATTVIKWDGPDDAVMLLCNGVRYSKFGRLTWDGGGKNVSAIFHEWDGHTPNASTSNEHSDEVFRDVAFGIRAGKPHFMDAETVVSRCKFQRVSVAGVRIQSFNALDWFIRDCEFEDCAVGVTNDPGAGNFHVFRSIFRRSTVADIAIRNALYFSIRHNLSIGSKQFVRARNIQGWAVPLTIQDNTVIDTTDPTSIQVENPGPTLLLDNIVRSRSEQTGKPAVSLESGIDGDYVTVGNTFTVKNPIVAQGRWLDLQTTITASDTIKIPELSGAVTPAAKNRTVIEVSPSADATAIQSAIDRAGAMRGQRPIVHLSEGRYNIATTLTIPAGSDVQIVGDGDATQLTWTGGSQGPVVSVPGPVRSTFRDFVISANHKVVGLAIANADQPGSRVYGDQLSVQDSNNGLLVDQLDQTDVSFDTLYHGGNFEASVKVVGGANAAAGRPTPARTVIFGGASSNSPSNYVVAHGGRLMAQDIWYEGGPLNFVTLTDFGTFTLSGAEIAPGRPGPNASPTEPGFAGVTLDHFSGRATFLTTCFQTRVVVRGDDPATNLLLLADQTDAADFLSPPSPAVHAAAISIRRSATKAEGNPPTRSLPDLGKPDSKWLLDMLQQVRTDTPRPLTVIPDGSTDLRLYRVTVQGCSTAVQLQR
jgi:hypothetical protein